MGKRAIVVDKTKDAEGLTAGVAEGRLQTFNNDYPQLDPSQFASEDAYREALLNQYRGMRGDEYALVCKDVGIKNYDLSVTLCDRTGDRYYMNTQAWNGCRDADRRFPDMRAEIADSAYVRIPTHVTESLAGHGSYACCAVSSKAIESKISAEMGFDGSQNFVQHYSSLNNGASYHRAPIGMLTDPATKAYCVSGSLWKLAETGKIGPGASIAIPSKAAKSGYHSKTVIAVDYDKDGHLKSITLQGNNNNSLETIGPNQKYKYSNIKACDMNRWMNQKLDQQMQNMQRNMSTKDLEAAVAAQRSTVETRISDLQATESHLFANHRNSDVQDYAGHYINNANIPSATPTIMRTDHNQAMEKANQVETQTRAQTSTLGISVPTVSPTSREETPHDVLSSDPRSPQPDNNKTGKQPFIITNMTRQMGQQR